MCKLQAKTTEAIHEDATLTLCQLLSHSGDHDAAVARLEGLLEVRPNSTAARLALLDTHHRAGKSEKLEEAMQKMERSLISADDDTGYHLCRRAPETCV